MGHPYQHGCPTGRTADAAASPRPRDASTPCRDVSPHASIACATDAPNATYACAHAALARATAAAASAAASASRWPVLAHPANATAQSAAHVSALIQPPVFWGP